MRFEFATAGRILFGTGMLLEAGTLGKDLGRRALVVTGRSPARALDLQGVLDRAGISSVVFTVEAEPTTRTVADGVEFARAQGCDWIAGIGGGSAIDAGKAIAAMLTNPGDLYDYLEVVGQGKPLPNAPAPFMAIPTTAGTGSEVTRNAVLGSPQHRVKVSLRSPLMLPRIAIVDPALTLGLPSAITAATGLDALTQVIEPFVSAKANPMVDSLCREGIQRAARSLAKVCQNGSDLGAREDMSLASLFGGLALANAGLGAVHGFAGPIGGMFAAPHGAICASLLPWVMAANVQALRHKGDQKLLDRFDEVARLITGKTTVTAMDGTHWVADLVRSLAIPPLRVYGITRADIPEIVEKASQASSMKGNPVSLSKGQLSEILSQAL